MWTPDVYEGAPTPITAFFAAAPKVAGMAMFVLPAYFAVKSGGSDSSVVVIFGAAVVTALGFAVAWAVSRGATVLAVSTVDMGQ